MYIVDKNLQKSCKVFAASVIVSFQEDFPETTLSEGIKSHIEAGKSAEVAFILGNTKAKGYVSSFPLMAQLQNC